MQGWAQKNMTSNTDLHQSVCLIFQPAFVQFMEHCLSTFYLFYKAVKIQVPKKLTLFLLH